MHAILFFKINLSVETIKIDSGIRDSLAEVDSVCGCAYVCEVSTLRLFWLCADYRVSSSTVLYHCSFTLAPCDFPLQASHGQLFPKQKGEERKGEHENESTCNTVNQVTNTFAFKQHQYPYFVKEEKLLDQHCGTLKPTLMY